MPVTTRKRSFYGSRDVTSLANDGNLIETISEKPTVTEAGRPKSNQRIDSQSWYEQIREKNLRANADFLSNLNINATKNVLSKSLSRSVTPQAKKAPAKRIKQEVIIESKQYQLRSRSSNTTGGALKDGDTDSKTKPSWSKHEVNSLEESYWETKTRQETLTWKDVCTNKESMDIESLNTKSGQELSLPSSTPVSCDDFISTCKTMTVYENTVAKVTPKRIFSLSIHPSVDKSPLIAAGDKWGYIGLWSMLSLKENQIKGKEEVALFRPHSRPINCLKFSPYNSAAFYSSSYDGTFRKCDISKQVFSLLYNTKPEDDIGLMYMDYVDNNTITIAQTDGVVCVLDERSNKPVLYDIQAGKMKCISHHPIKRHYFITGCVQGRIELWDMRYVKNASSSLKRLPSSKGVLSSYFSPLTGNRILSCSADDSVRVYESENLDNITMVKDIRHNNYTGRWLTNFRATWHPAREDSFVIGAMKHPRQVELYNVNGKIMHTFTDNEYHFNSITSIHTFHPTLPVLVGANSSGKVYVFTTSQV